MQSVWTYLMTTDFELGHIPSSVLVGRALNVTELSLVRRVIVVDVQG